MKKTIHPDGRVEFEGTAAELREFEAAPGAIVAAPYPLIPNVPGGGWTLDGSGPVCSCPKAEPGTVMGWGGWCPVHSVRCLPQNLGAGGAAFADSPVYIFTLGAEQVEASMRLGFPAPTNVCAGNGGAFVWGEPVKTFRGWFYPCLPAAPSVATARS